jgi:putative ABC transport system permease protein
MKELFGLSMNIVMAFLLAVFLSGLVVVLVMAFRNRIMLKMGLRPIPRRLGQTVLTIVGVMLSTVIISAAFGTGDTLSFSIRDNTLQSLKTIDEVIFPAQAGADDSFANLFFPYERFQQLQQELADLDTIDGLAPQLAMAVPSVNQRSKRNEGFLRVVGIQQDLTEGFGPFELMSGQQVTLDALGPGEAFINDRAADELEAVVGDKIELFIGGERLPITVKGIIQRGGLAGNDPTLLMTLELAQELFERPGEINSIIVSNRGDAVEGLRESKEVTQRLRVLFSDREVASRLKSLLAQKVVLAGLEMEEENVGEHLRGEVRELQSELVRDELSNELLSLLADEDISGVVLSVLEGADELQEIEREALTLFEDLAEFRVLEFKRRFLGFADDAGSFVTTFFLVFSLFSITVGILLIFLIFILLAAARRSEMGMARAVGAKRSHLVQMFTFEGTAYALASSAVGVILGLAVSAAMIVVINQLFATFEEDFTLSVHFELRTVIVSYCLGMVITFATVAGSAYRVSRLNIVSAIRNLPEAIVFGGEATLRQRLLPVLWALGHPAIFLLRGVRALVRRRWGRFVGYTALGIIWVLPIVWIIDIAVSLLRFAWPYLLRGWLTLIIGLVVIWWAVAGVERLSIFTGGVSVVILGLGLTLRASAGKFRMRLELFGILILLSGMALLPYAVVTVDVLSMIISIALLILGAAMAAPFLAGKVERRPDLIDRMAFTFIGVLMLAFWTLPSGPFPDFIDDLQGDFDMMFVSGIFMVAAAVWSIMYNADLLLKGLVLVTGRVGKLRPVLVMAVAYPMSDKVRTGLTLAMFALVIFTLMVMSILTEIFSTQFSDADVVLGGWVVNGRVNANTPIENIRQRIVADPELRIEEFAAIGGFTETSVQARQVGGESQRWNRVDLLAANDDYLRASEYQFKLIADGYGTTPEEVWQALIDNPTLAIVGGYLVPTVEGDAAEREFDPILEDLFYKDKKMSPLEIEVREPRTRATVALTVIAVLDRVHDNSGTVVTSKAVIDNLMPFSVPITHYRFKLAQGVEASRAAKSLEASFLEHGMNTEVGQEELDKESEAGRTFRRLFIGFMSLGLLVGVAALGVVSTRAVVERRQQIGVLRAIGYRRGMIQLSFLLESSFIALLGMLIGTTLGIVLGWQAFNDIKDQEGIETLRFAIPWGQIALILVMTYAFSLLATFFPARQAAKTYPAEALRYE